MASGGGTCNVEDPRHLLRQLSHQSSSESGVGEELELLSNVYFDDLQISSNDKCHSLTLHITPSTADDKDRQYVYLDLSITLPAQYPHRVPDICLGQSRGLSDAHLRGISEGLALKSAELVGAPMIYELVEYARECLTDNNLPCSRCAVCQMHFQDGDDFTKTDCYHYLHVVCLARYIEFFERERREMEREEALVDTMLRKKPKQLECPVCREAMLPTSSCLDVVRRVQLDAVRSDDVINFTPSSKLKAWQKEMSVLFWQQKQKGGVIDPNNEDDVIDESWVSSGSRKENSEPVKMNGEKEFPEESKEPSSKISKKTSEVIKLVDTKDTAAKGGMVDGRVGADRRDGSKRGCEYGQNRRRRDRGRKGQASERTGQQRSDVGRRVPNERMSGTERNDSDRDGGFKGQKYCGRQGQDEGRGGGRGRCGERGQRRDNGGRTREYQRTRVPREDTGQRSRGGVRPNRGRRADSAVDQSHTKVSRDTVRGGEEVSRSKTDTKNNPSPLPLHDDDNHNVDHRT